MNITQIENQIRAIRARMFDLSEDEQETAGQEIARLKILAKPFWDARTAEIESRRMSVYLMD